jgi:DNA-binding transcriptional ArsR family regulator
MGGLALEALGDPTRRAIFERLVVRPRSVRALADVVPVSRPAVSQHLKVLKQFGLVVDRAEGTRRIYRVDPAGVAAMREYLDQMWDDFEQAEQDCHALGEGILFGTVAISPDILGRQWQVEGIDAVGRRCCQPHHLPTGRLGNTAVLVFGVDDDAVGAVDELPQDMQLAEEALAGAGGRHDDQVGCRGNS